MDASGSDKMIISEDNEIPAYKNESTTTKEISNSIPLAPSTTSLPSIQHLFPSLPRVPDEFNQYWSRDDRMVGGSGSRSLNQTGSTSSNGIPDRHTTSSKPKPWNNSNLLTYAPSSNSQRHEAIYDSYGSSVVSVNPLAQPLRPPARSSGPNSTSQHDLAKTTAPETPFDPEKLGLPVPPDKAASKNWAGLYSSSGFDLVGVLARVVLRPDPELVLGPIDLSCSFVVCDATLPTCPILYASETFSRMTCYENEEVLGQNCKGRFLQSPEGAVHHKHKRPDNNLAALEMKEAIANGRESQVSLVNYHKGGRPFMNLVSIIPVTWDTDKISYFVGFQVDLGAQPSAVNHMSDGTFCVNYSQTRDIPPTIRTKWPVPDSFGRLIVAASAVAKVPAIPPMSSTTTSSLGATMMATTTTSITASTRIVTPSTSVVTPLASDILGITSLENVLTKGLITLASDKARMAFNRLVIEQALDFVHVLTLKGTLLYVSPASRQLFDLDPDDLTGKPLASFCHPSDVVNVLRDLKELAAGPGMTVTLLYRMKKRNGGYVWLESTGKLLIQPGKGRKCVILSGRPREVYKLSQKAIERKGGFGEQEFWSKLSADGKILYSTPQIQNVLGFSEEEIVGTSIDKLSPGGGIIAAIKALAISESEDPVTLNHIIETKSGPVDVVTPLFLTPSSGTTDLNYFAVISQTNLYASEKNKRPFVDSSLIVAPSPAAQPSQDNSSTDPTTSSTSPNELPSTSTSTLTSTAMNVDSTPVVSSPAPTENFVSTYKNLQSTREDNLFRELEVTHGASIHFELQQLRIANKKLREERDLLLATQALKRPPPLDPKA